MSLTILHTPTRIRKLMVYDLEWNPFTMQLRICGVYDGKNYRYYSSIAAFFNAELTPSNQGKWFYAHFGGGADMLFLLKEIKKDARYSVDASFSSSSAIIVTIKRGRLSWTFVDSYWLLRDKLSNIAKFIGMEKGGPEDPLPSLPDEEFNRIMAERREWYATAPFAELRLYNEQDCVILWKAIDAFENVLLQVGGMLQKTLASCSMLLFRKRFLAADIQTNAEINDIARKAYIASRVEDIQRNVKDALYYDINSSFPYAMTKPCPGEVRKHGKRIPHHADSLYLANCDVTVPDCFLPPLPIRVKGRVFFPFGTWNAWLTNVDIELLEKTGGKITRVREVIEFEPFHDLADFAQTLYKMRRDSKEDMFKQVLKLLLNSLYGKFAESEEKTKLRFRPPADWDFTHSQMLFPGAFLETQLVPIPHMHVPISAHITAQARATLYDFMSHCREVHYCDTDGFSTTESLATGKELGQLKLEKKVDNGIFLAPKVYSIEGKTLNKDGAWEEIHLVKAKGFSRLNVERFFEIMKGKEIEFERMGRIKEQWRKGITEPTNVQVKKRMRLENHVSKRFHYPDGHSRPWHVSELPN